MVDKSQLYVADGAEVYIYSLTDLTLKKKFGKAGEGPREFKIGGRKTEIHVQSENIIVNSTARLSFFTKDGAFIKEMNAPFGRGFQPLGNDFVGWHHVTRKDKQIGMNRSLKLRGPDLEELKELCIVEGKYIRGKGYRVFSEPPVFRVHEGKIFVGGRKDFTIRVFDKNGAQLSPITMEYERQAVNEEHKKGVINYIKTSPDYRETRDFFIKVLLFPDLFPAIWDFHVDKGRIYVLTYKLVEGKTETFIFDTKGQLLKKVFLPIHKENHFRVTSPFAVGNGNLYQLIENDDEEWQIFIHPAAH
jgi:hypothetical protein